MEALIIPGSTNTPNVKLNHRTNRFEIGGTSLPENVLGFYTPVMNWIKEYLENPNPETIFEFRFSYLNTASTKIISNIMRALNDAYKDGNNISIVWYYDFEDAEIKELGLDLSELLDLPVQILVNE